MSDLTPRRRTVLGTAALAGLAPTTALAACSSESGSASGEQGPSEPVDLGKSEDVPVGGAKLYRKEKVIVSRPEENTFEAFSAVCTHKGCIIAEVKETEAICTCHGSRFDAVTGKVLEGPATKPLPSVPVAESAGKLTAG